MKKFTCFILGKNLTAFASIPVEEQRGYHNMVLAWIMVSLMGALTGADIAHNFTDDIGIIILSALGASLLIGFADYLILSSNAKGFLGIMSGILRFKFALLITILAAISAVGLLFDKDIENKLSDDNFDIIESIEQEFEVKRDSLYADVRFIEKEIQDYHSSVCIPESHKTRCGPECERKHAYCLSRQKDIDEMMPDKLEYEEELKASKDSKIAFLKSKSAGISERYSTLFTMMQNDMVKKWLAIILFGIIFLFDLQALIAKITVSKNGYEKRKKEMDKKFGTVIKDEIVSKAENDIKIKTAQQRIDRVKEMTKSYREAMRVADESFKDLEGGANFIKDLERVKKKHPEIAPLVRESIEAVQQTEKSLIHAISNMEIILPDLSSLDDILFQTASDDVTNGDPAWDISYDKVERDKVPISKTDLFYVTLGMKVVIKDLWKKSKGNPFAYAKAAYEWICKNIAYNYEHTHEYQMTAREVYNAKTGQCLEMAILFVAMMRYKNIESRPAYVDVDNKGEKVSHGCALVVLYGQKILVDPAYNTWNIKHKDWKAISDDELHEHMIYWNA